MNTDTIDVPAKIDQFHIRALPHLALQSSFLDLKSAHCLFCREGFALPKNYLPKIILVTTFIAVVQKVSLNRQYIQMLLKVQVFYKKSKL